MNRRSFIVASFFAGPTILAAKECTPSNSKPKLLEAHLNKRLSSVGRLGPPLEPSPSMIIVFKLPQTNDPREINFVKGVTYQFERTHSDGTITHNVYGVTCVHDAPDNAVIGVYHLGEKNND